ncbi:lipase family protein [Sciscionella marina]|uniref:lipase family protein n=1 Tax=Sciscionella marina TaxID=508770 RepID=UPI000475A9B7|nr:lipase family protein [Sciscionella marina]
MRFRLRLVAACVAALSVFGMGSAAAATGSGARTVEQGKVPAPQDDPFYRYTGSKPLSEIAPGTVLKTRLTQMHFEKIPLPVQVVQLLYRTTDTQGRVDVAATSVFKPSGGRSDKLVSYQSAYDALSPNCQPSYAIAGGFDPGFIASAETMLIPLLLHGYTVAIPDFEGTKLHYTAGPENGKMVLDGIRAAQHSADAGLTEDAKVAIGGYSGGAIGTEWAAEQAPQYAPDVDRRLVLASLGGVFADPVHNIHYVDGSLVWAGVMPMAFAGLSRAYGINLDKYLSPLGKDLIAKAQNSCIAGATLNGVAASLKKFSTIKFADLVKPQYAKPESIPEVVSTLNDLIMGSHGTPTVPMLFQQGLAGEVDGTFDNNKPGIGRGDGVMVAGDVRSLARKYCAAGVPVDYKEQPLEHGGTAGTWALDTMTRLPEAFRGDRPKNTCASIKPGNSLDPIAFERPGAR